MLHRFDNEDSFVGKMHDAELAYLIGSPAARASLAENYVGLPY